MSQLRWMLRMKRWAQRPPSASHVKFVFGVILACGLLYAFEYFYGWPEALTPDISSSNNKLPKF
jgi:hypothetical protein